MEGYISKDSDLMIYINKFKKQNSIQNNAQRNRIMTNIKKASEIKNKFALGDDEVENIFRYFRKGTSRLMNCYDECKKNKNV